MRRSVFLLLCLAMAAPAHAGLERYMTGNPADVSPPLHGPIIQLEGGSTDIDEAFQEVIDRIRGCTDCDAKIDVVILRASGEDGYNDYIYKMNGVDSVETLVITDRMSAYRPDVVRSVRNAEYVFFAGGDQCNYITYIAGTPIEQALREVYARGGAIGGTSAGMAIQGGAVYDACHDASATSVNALADPYNDEISFTDDFLNWPYLGDVITDTHFAQRDRMGRLFAFLARQFVEHPHLPSFLGIACNEKTAVLVDGRGVAEVVGAGPAYFVLADHLPEKLEPGKPLTFCGYKLWRVPTGLSFDLANRPKSGFYAIDVVDGKVLSNPY